MTDVALASPRPAIGFFERYLSLWVAAWIVVGIALGYALPGLFGAIAAAEVARVHLVVAGLIWLMIVPMLLKIDLAALGSVRQHWKGVGVTLFIHWAGKPFSMALLGTLFLGWLFRPLLPQAERAIRRPPAMRSWRLCMECSVKRSCRGHT